MSAVKRKRRRRGRTIGILLALFLFLSLVTVFSVMVGQSLLERETAPPPSPPESATLPASSASASPSSEPQEVKANLSQAGVPIYGESSSIADENYEYLQMAEEDIYKGTLILVNHDHPYRFPAENDLVSVFSIKNASYQVRDKNVTLSPLVTGSLNEMLSDFEERKGRDDVMVLSGFRDYELQASLYTERAERDGEAEAALYTAQAGHSEHHTGFALDLSLYSDELGSRDFTGNGDYGWINQNCSRYGFIVRYPVNKKEITQIAYEPWHFRYIGEPHASYVSQTGICFEEYITLLHQYDFSGEHLVVTAPSGSRYEIYHVTAGADKTTRLPVPKEGEYTVSGDNVDGFIVTVKLS